MIVKINTAELTELINDYVVSVVKKIDDSKSGAVKYGLILVDSSGNETDSSVFGKPELHIEL